VKVRGLLDGGSNASYIHVNILKRLLIQPSRETLLEVQRYGSAEPTYVPAGRIEVTFIELHGRKKSCSLYTSNCVLGHASLSPHPEEVASLLQSGYLYADPDLFRPCKNQIEVLIGNDLRNLFVRLNRDKKIVDGLVLKPTFFGWIPSGRAVYNVATLLSLSTAPSGNVDNHNAMNEFLRSPDISLLWSLEVLGIKNPEITTASLDEAIMREFCDTRHFDPEQKQFFVSFPLCSPVINLPTHFRMCVACLKALLRDANQAELARYDETFQEYYRLGIIE